MCCEVLFHGATAPMGQGLIVEASRSHSDTPHSRIRTLKPSKRAARDPRLRPRGHRERLRWGIAPCILKTRHSVACEWLSSGLRSSFASKGVRRIGGRLKLQNWSGRGDKEKDFLIYLESNPVAKLMALYGLNYPGCFGPKSREFV
jgi:hypothetical protein